jgi:hypothetical protein
MIGMMMSPTSDVTMAPKARADDDADRQIDHVAFHGKFAELLQHSQPLLFS